MTSLLSPINKLSYSLRIVGQNSSATDQLKQIYENTRKMLSEKMDRNRLLSIFQNYQNQVSNLLISNHLKENNSEGTSIQNSRKSSISEDSGTEELISKSQKEQSSYVFLRNLWQGRQSVESKDYEAQDHIDRISKVVAMMKTRINYMTKKENYVYEKQQTNNQHIFQNPLFIKVKEEMERLFMENQEISQKCHRQAQIIERLQKQKANVESNLRNLKKKFQQMQKSWIHVSKKNICLQQESLVIKSQNSKSKLNALRQSADMNIYASRDLKGSLSFKKLHDQIKSHQHLPLQTKEQCIEQEHKQPFRQLQNVFVDIKLKANKQTRPSDRYQKQNEQIQDSSCLKDVTEKINTGNNEIPQNGCEKLLIEASPLKFKHIKLEGSGRKTLLSSARSVDLIEKTSLNKPKFERTKPNHQHLLKSMGKDGCVIDINLEKPSLLKKQNILSDETSQLRTFKSSQRDTLESKKLSETNNFL